MNADLKPAGRAIQRTQTRAERSGDRRQDGNLDQHIRICDLFGLSVEGATRDLATVEHPELQPR
jgi:hypothetical protein